MTAMRRDVLKGLGVLGAAALGAPAAGAAEGGAPAAREEAPDARARIRARIAATTLVDTHEHLPDEADRLRGAFVECDDWGVLFSQYLDSDLIAAGMPKKQRDLLCGRGADSEAKWRALEPYWPAVKHTCYGQAVLIAIRELYGVEELNGRSIPEIAQAYEKLRVPGMYRRVLAETAGIESCQVNFLWGPFKESRQPTFLLQDLSFLGMHIGPDIRTFAEPAGIEVKNLEDWHRVIAWWFDRYGPYAVAVKSQAAYLRGLDYEQVPARDAAPLFARHRAGESLDPAERKRLEDHLFWFCVGEATRRGLPVKLHTGYYAGANGMPIARVRANPGEAAALCRGSPQTTFVFMHIGYPCWQEMIALAKHYTNAVIDMCWAWIIDPAASKEFLKSYIAAAPANKVLTFGGDYIPVECVAGHARLARRGIARALEELVAEETLGLDDALALVDPLMRGNARAIFRIEEKIRRLESAPWL